MVVGEFRKFSTVRVSILFGVSAILNNSTIIFSLPPSFELLRRLVFFCFIFFSVCFYFFSPSVSASGCAVRRRQVDEEWNDIGRGKGGSIHLERGIEKNFFFLATHTFLCHHCHCCHPSSIPPGLRCSCH